MTQIEILTNDSIINSLTNNLKTEKLSIHTLTTHGFFWCLVLYHIYTYIFFGDVASQTKC